MTQLRSGVGHEVRGPGSLRCLRHSYDWSSCPRACGETRGARRHERAEEVLRVGWARMTLAGVAVGVQSPPPVNYTGHDKTG